MDVPVTVTVSAAARLVWRQELDESFGVALERWSDAPGFSHYPPGDLLAPIASGTHPTAGMAIVPCSMATVAAVAHGLADNLVRRAADVCIKERRPLVIVPRESPLSAIHLDNMAALARLGVTILPPEPAFYLKPKTVDDVVAFVVARVVHRSRTRGRPPGRHALQRRPNGLVDSSRRRLAVGQWQALANITMEGRP